MSFPEDALRADGFLGGRLRIWQPIRGYRAGIDPVLLAASVTASPGESVLDLGCGAGTALLCLGRRVGGLGLVGVERQDDYADLARRNVAENGLSADVVTADLSALPAELRQRRFDHVIANPPYFPPGTRTPSPDGGREGGLGEETPLADWVAVAAARARPGGFVTMIQRADRLGDLLSAMQSRLGDLAIRPVAPRAGREARLILLRGRAGARGPLRLLAPLVLHEGDRHEKDGESYRIEIQAVLRDGAALAAFD